MITPNIQDLEPEIKTVSHTEPTPQVISVGLGSFIHARFAALGGVKLDIPPRSDMPRATNFDSNIY